MAAEPVGGGHGIVLSAGTARGAGTGQALRAALAFLAGQEEPVLAFVPDGVSGAAGSAGGPVALAPVGRLAGLLRDVVGRPDPAVWIGFCDRLPLWGAARARRVLVVQNPHLYGPVTAGASIGARLRRIGLGAWARWSLRHADLVIVSSSSSRHDVEAATRVDPTRVVVRPIPPHGLGPPKAGHAESIADVVLVGDLYAYKQFDHAVRGLEQFAAAAGRTIRVRHFGAERDAAGARSFSEAVAGAAHLAVERCGPRPHAEVVEAMRTADALVFVSARETYGLPLAEALAIGLPVVCTDIGPFRDLAEGVAVFVPAAAPPAAIADAVAGLDDPAERTRRAAEGRSRLGGEGGWDVVSAP